MPALINPLTNLTFDHEKLVEELKLWTRDKGVLEAIVAGGLGFPIQLRALAQRLRATGDPTWAEAKRILPLTEKEVATVMFCYLRSRGVRLAIARLFVKHGRMGKAEAVKELWRFKEELQKTYRGADEC